MCGIAGLVEFENSITPEHHNRMTQAIEKMHLRGPDDNGITYNKNWIFGHTRLTIIDLKNGVQPLEDKETGVTLTYNGEIYNFRELRKTLEKKGHIFITHCDTEVLLKSYLEWGEDCVNHFNGFFAFAICDSRKNAIFAARDRVGIKPFYYSLDKNSFIFSSSIPVIKVLSNKIYNYNYNAISNYLSTGRFTFGEDTLLSGIKTLLPGHSISINFKEKKTKINRYWKLPIYSPKEKNDIPFEQACEKVYDLLNNSVKSRLVSDVPLGAFLSGGLDSAIITQTANKYSNHQIPLFCAGTNIDKYNEFEYAETMAKSLGLNLDKIVITPENFMDNWDFLMQNKGMPLSTPNEVAIYNLSKNLKQKCSVTLTGEGADEIFGGYTQPQFSAYDFDRCARSEELADTNSSFALSMIMENGRSFFINDTDHYTSTGTWFNYLNKENIFKNQIWNDKLNNDNNFYAYYEDFFDSVKKCSSFDKRMHLHANLNLENLLSRVDNSTMSASVEARVPFTDHNIIEFAFALPDNYKMNWASLQNKKLGANLITSEIDKLNLLETKRLPRNAFNSLLPKSIIDRKKMSFPTPFTEWFYGPLYDDIKDLCMSSSLTNTLFKQSSIEKILETKNRNLWLIANLCKWNEITDNYY